MADSSGPTQPGAGDLASILTRWHPEQADPLTREQYDVLASLVGEHLTEAAVEGFLVVCSRFVDEYGGHRTEELQRIFRTDRPEGRQALIDSLEHMCSWVGGMPGYERDYPVEIRGTQRDEHGKLEVVELRPAFPQFRIVGIERLAPVLYRVLHATRSVSRHNPEPALDFIVRTGRLPPVARQRLPVRRHKPNYHWCAYEAWATPQSTREALQILPEWSDCSLRATLATEDIAGSAFMAFSGDRVDPENDQLRFYKYFYEPLTQDHPELPGGAVQIGVDGSPPVRLLEVFDEPAGRWRVVYRR